LHDALPIYRREEADQDRPEQVPDNDRGETGDEPDLQEVSRCQRPDEERRRHQVGREPHREDAAHGAVTRRLRDGLEPVGFDPKVTLACGHAFASQRSCRHACTPSPSRRAEAGASPFRSRIVNVTGTDSPPAWTTDRAGCVSATTRPSRTTPTAGGRSRLASASSSQSRTMKFAGLPSSSPYSTYATRAGFVLTIT